MAAPTRAKRRLGQFLLACRTQAAMTLHQAADELRSSASTVSRYEAGEVMPVWSTVKTLLDHYMTNNAADQAEAVRLWDAARAEPSPARLPMSTPRALRRLIHAERESAFEQCMEVVVVPGLLQTESYARAINADAERYFSPPTRVDGLVASRLNRQRRLAEPDALRLHAVLDEVVIRRTIGGTQTMHEQLAHLVNIAELPNITVQVVPLTVGVYGTMSGACTIVGDLPPRGPTGVYLEYPTGGAWVDKKEDVNRLTAMFDSVSSLALSPSDTTNLIREQMTVLEHRDEYQDHQVA
ncbi:MAG: helix-turn-helix domain-containing protein [Actinomycetota bacterium]|nr:helix-turn-helix domain-containing protein [Actinomycetota bacterium]